MHVVFTGQTGVEKDDVMEAVAKMAAKERGVPEALGDRITRGFIRCYSVEAKIKESLNGRIRAFLDNFYARQRQNVWEEAFGKCLEEVNRDNPEHAFLSFHSLYRRQGQFFSCLSWKLIMEFRPQVFITLIDDVFDVRTRVTTREKKKVETKSSFQLPELLTWRSSEILMTDCLAQNLYPNRPVPHFIVAVKSPALMLYRLLFQKKILRVYASFPISKQRSDPRKQKEINDFRLELHKHFTVFDPITIDELRFDDSKNLVKRWPLEIDPIVSEESADKKMLEEPEIGYSKVNELRKMVARQIESRDYSWVDSSNVVVAYKPTWDKTQSAGVDKEMTYAIHLGKEVFAVMDQEDQEYAEKSGPFAMIGRVIVKRSTREIVDALIRIQKDKTKRESPEGGNKEKVR